MKIVTKQELHDFIMEQPDDRPVNMMEFHRAHKPVCGCIMWQYGKHMGWEFDGCSSHTWYGHGLGDILAAFSEEDTLHTVIKFGPSNMSKTYGELKKTLIKN